MIDRFSPTNMAPPFSKYSQGVEIPASARTVIVGGQVGVNPDGSMSDDMKDQTLQDFQNIENVLKAKDMGLEDLVETRTYIISINDLSGYREGRAAAFKHCQVYPKPTVALLVVNSLAQAHWKIEICATAAKL